MNSAFSKILSYGIIGITIILTIVGIIAGRGKDAAGQVVFNPNILIYTSYALIGLVIAGVVFGFVLNSISNPKSLLIPIISVATLGILFLIAYLTASNEKYGKPLPVIDADLSQKIGGILTLTYILMGLAFGAIIFAWGRKVIR